MQSNMKTKDAFEGEEVTLHHVMNALCCFYFMT